MNEYDRHVAIDWSKVIAAVAALIFALFFAILVLYLITAETKAIPFDADGVRCFARALAMDCIQTTAHP